MRAVYELRQKYNITSLLKCAGVPRSTYYYHVDRFGRKDKYGEIKKLIQEIFQENHGRYGYRRITLALHNRGCQINHKTVRRILGDLSRKPRNWVLFVVSECANTILTGDKSGKLLRIS